MSTEAKDLFDIIRQLTKLLRFCRQESMFCDGVTFTQFNILDLIVQKGCCEALDLRHLLQVEKSTLTRLIQPLVKQNLLVKEPSPRDSRGIVLKLTDEGKTKHQSIKNCLAGFFHQLEQQIPESKRKTMYEGLSIFIQSLQSCCNENC